MKSLSILLIGSGAIAGLYGGKLSQSGARVSMLCGRYMGDISKNGFSVKSIWGDFTYKPDNLYSSLPKTETYPDIILVCTKALPSVNIAELIKPAVGSHTVIVLLQNGLHCEDTLIKAYPEHEVCSGLAFVYAERMEPAIIRHHAFGNLVFGLYPEGKSAFLEPLVALFQSVGVPTTLSLTVKRDRWLKLMWNAAFNPLSVISGGFDTQKLCQIMRPRLCHVMKDILKLAEADGYVIEEDICNKSIKKTEAMPPYKTSMLSDFENGRPLEIEAILGNAIHFSHEKNIKVPHLQVLYDDLMGCIA